MNSAQVSLLEQSNQLVAAFESKDQSFNDIINKVDEMTISLLSDEIPNVKKYDTIMSIEYLLVRARIQTETESLNVKRILSTSNDLPASIKGLFIKRDQYLAQVSLKLNSIRDEISNLQKVVYCGSNFIRK